MVKKGRQENKILRPKINVRMGNSTTQEKHTGETPLIDYQTEKKTTRMEDKAKKLLHPHVNKEKLRSNNTECENS